MTGLMGPPPGSYSHPAKNRIAQFTLRQLSHNIFANLS